MKKILVVALGGTIGSIWGNKITPDKNPLKVLDYYKGNAEFECVSPFVCLSENMTRELWRRLIDCLNGIDWEKYEGIIILHGSDTLAYTSAIIANAFWDKNIVLVAADKPIECKESNGIKNFEAAVKHLLSHKDGVYVSYNGIKKGDCVTSADVNDEFKCIKSTIPPAKKKKISDKNVLIIKPFVGINLKSINTDLLDGVIFEMYHSATVPKETIEFSSKLNCPYIFVTHKKSADYESAIGIKNIVFECTVENAYAHMILE